MKIAHVVNTFPPYWSGTGIVALNMAQSLSKLGHEVHVFTPKTNDNKDQIYTDVIVHKQKTVVRIGQAPLSPGLFGLSGFDVIHLHFPYYFGAEIITLVSALKKIPVVISYHNDVIKPGFSGDIVRLHTKTIAPWILGRADCICVMTEQFQQESLLLSGLKNKQKVRIIPQGVDTSRFSPGAEKQSIPGLEKGTPFVLFVRTLDEAHFHSGLDYLLQAMVHVTNECHLVIIGDGKLRQYYQQISLELGIANRVQFLGAVKNEYLPNYYSAASLFVLPSAETENAGVVLLEAMVCGKPVIVTNVGGSKEIIRNGITGFLVPPKDSMRLAEKINFLIRNPDTAKKIGDQACLDISNSSSWNVIAKRILDVYKSII